MIRYVVNRRSKSGAPIFCYAAFMYEPDAIKYCQEKNRAFAEYGHEFYYVASVIMGGREEP